MWRSNQLSYRTLSGSEHETAAAPSFYFLSFYLNIDTEKRNNTASNKALTNQRISIENQKQQYIHIIILNSQFPILNSDILSRKEVFQPHLPVRLPCYDLAPITGFALGRPSRSRTSGAPSFHGLTGGVYKARERIHRAMADARLLANPASWGRVADPNPNYETFS